MAILSGVGQIETLNQERRDVGRAERLEAEALASGQRLELAERVRRIMQASGAGCTYPEVRRHLSEDNLDCPRELFGQLHLELFPPAEDWHAPVKRKEKPVIETTPV